MFTVKRTKEIKAVKVNQITWIRNLIIIFLKDQKKRKNTSIERGGGQESELWLQYHKPGKF